MCVSWKMAARKVLIVLMVFGLVLIQNGAVSSFERESELDEDSILEEIASYVRRQSQQQHPKNPEFSRNFVQQDQLNENNPKKFAFRPDEPEFQKTWRPRETFIPSANIVPRTESENVRKTGGQKENIDFISNLATVAPDSATRQRQAEISPETPTPLRESAKINEPNTADENLVLKVSDGFNHDDSEKFSEGPVAHAIIAPDSRDLHYDNSLKDIYFTALVAGCTAAVVTVTIGFGVCVYSWQKSRKLAKEVEYPAYGITGPNRNSSSIKKSGSPGFTLASPKKAGHGDKKLAQSAHMFHFQHQKQQVIAMENNSIERGGSNSGAESDEDDNEEGDYTVYECPGLAPTGEMEVKNPLFPDDPTPLDNATENP
nr:EOG090X0B4J [Eulimnadia texana]